MPFNGDGCYSVVADNEEDFYLQIQRGVLFKMKLNAQGQVMAITEWIRLMPTLQIMISSII